MKVHRAPILLFFALFAVRSFGQDQSHPAIGGYETQGTITAGYRFTDVRGRTEKFTELFNLRDGFRLHDLALFGQAEESGKRPDSYSLTASGIGGDPFSASQFRLTRKHVYDLRVSYRQSYFYWDRNDDADQPTGLHGLTTDNDFATVRRIGPVNWSAYATSKLRFNLDYNRSERAGTIFTLRTLDYYGSPSTYGAFLRANPYQVEMPLNEGANRVSAGVAYSTGDWNVFYRAGYQDSHQNQTLRNLVAAERSINIDEAATNNERLTSATWVESRSLKSPISEFSYNGQVGSRLRLRGSHLYYRYSGPATIDASFAGNARTVNASTFAPFTASMNAKAKLKEPNHVIDQGIAIVLKENALFHADYRYARFTMSNIVDYSSLDSAGPHLGKESVQWREGLQILDLAMELTPRKGLLLRPGVRFMKRDVHQTRDDILNVVSSRPSRIVSPLLSLYYAPSARLTIRGDIRNSNNGGPYTRISARTDFRTRWVARYKVNEMFSVENNFSLSEAEYHATSFQNKIRSNSTTAALALNDKFNVFGGFIYDSFLATAAITFLRGTAPLDATWRDQTVNRVWEGGFEARPITPIEFRLSGNYLRTTGAGEISGELPTSGPLRWPMVTGTVAFHIPRAGMLSVDLQRTYYIEELVTGDNFSANILGVRWTKEF